MILRVVASFVLVCFTLIEPAFAQARFPFTGRVKADRVHVRAGQSNNYEEIAVLNKNADVVVLEKSYSWYKIRLPEGAKLYIKADYVKVISPEIGEIIGDRVNIRARANTTAAIIGQLVRGDFFFIQEKADQWFSIKPVPQAKGWVHEDLIEFKSAGAPEPSYLNFKDNPARVRIEQAETERKRVAAEQKHAAKFAWLKAQANSLYESEGVLLRESADKYQLVRGDKTGIVVAYIEGPEAILSGFVDVRVVVRGFVKDDPSWDAVKLAVTKINLAL